MDYFCKGKYCHCVMLIYHTILLAFVIVGFTSKFEDVLGPFKNELLSSWEVADGTPSTADDVCIMGIIGLATSSCGVVGLSMVIPTRREKVVHSNTELGDLTILPLMKSIDLDFDIDVSSDFLFLAFFSCDTKHML